MMTPDQFAERYRISMTRTLDQLAFACLNEILLRGSAFCRASDFSG